MTSFAFIIIIILCWSSYLLWLSASIDAWLSASIDAW